MIYPDFLQNGSTIGIAAPSAGVGDDIAKWTSSLGRLKNEGYQIKETAHVREDNIRSADARTRGEEFSSLFTDLKVDIVMCAAGGDFLDEALPYIDFDRMRISPKWVVGASDATNVLLPYTTKHDVASIYGLNAGRFADKSDYVQAALDILSGERLSEESYPRYMSKLPFMVDKTEYDTPSDMTCSRPSLEVRGRCIGGCIDVCKDLIGTVYDGTRDFIQRYREDGFIWYFDNFSMSAEVFYRTLLQMKYAGWFTGAKAVIFGRTAFESSQTGMTYAEAEEMAMGDIPYVDRADVGHTVPCFTMINGAVMDLIYKDGRLDLAFSLV